MPRIAPVPLDEATPEARELLEGMLAQRGYVPNLYATLAHTPGVARAFSAVVDATRTGLELEPLLRELAILAIARETGAAIQWLSHLPIARAAGATPEQLACLPAWEGSGAFTDLQESVMQFAKVVALEGQPDQATWADTRKRLSPRELVELAFIASFYSGISRFLNTLLVEPDAEYMGPALAAYAAGG